MRGCGPVTRLWWFDAGRGGRPWSDKVLIAAVMLPVGNRSPSRPRGRPRSAGAVPPATSCAARRLRNLDFVSAEQRLPALRPDDLDDAQRAVHAELTGGARGGVPTAADGSLAGPFNAMLHAPWVGGPLQELGAALRTRGTLPGRARELVVLAVSAQHRSEFEWWAHAPIADRLGVSPELVRALGEGRPAEPADELERVVLDAARALLVTGDLDDEQWSAAHRVLGDAGLVELSTLVGYYALLALQLRLFRVRPPDDDGARPPWR